MCGATNAGMCSATTRDSIFGTDGMAEQGVANIWRTHAKLPARGLPQSFGKQLGLDHWVARLQLVGTIFLQARDHVEADMAVGFR
jgi:hypothetical protein